MSDAARLAPGAGPRDVATISVTVNGQAREFAAGTTVAALLSALGAAAGPCAVEINQEIVPRSLHGSHLLADGDRIELVGFVGGG